MSSILCLIINLCLSVEDRVIFVCVTVSCEQTSSLNYCKYSSVFYIMNHPTQRSNWINKIPNYIMVQCENYELLILQLIGWLDLHWCSVCLNALQHMTHSPVYTHHNLMVDLFIRSDAVLLIKCRISIHTSSGCKGTANLWSNVAFKVTLTWRYSWG